MKYYTDESLELHLGDCRDLIHDIKGYDLDSFKHALELVEFETLFDPFIGTGTTLLCAKHRNKKAIGIEQNAKFCDITIERFKNPEKEFKL